MISNKAYRDTIHNPPHYTVYPVQPIEITRHLGFCLGNAVKYVLRAPYKGAVEDCDKALEYLGLEAATPQCALGYFAFMDVSKARQKLAEFLRSTEGDILWQDIADCQADFLDALGGYLCQQELRFDQWTAGHALGEMSTRVRQLKRVLELRDTIGQIYDGLTGLPKKEAGNE